MSYWLRKHDLSAHRTGRHAPKGKLGKEELEALLKAKLTLRQIADRLDRSVTTVRYWIAKHGLKANAQGRQQAHGEGERTSLDCRRHGKTTFVLEGRGYYRCAKCRAEGVAKRRRVIKRKLVEEAGGRCCICGYSRCQQALQFHHLDPATKEFQLGVGGLTRSLAKARAEATKCVLLCANCHAEVEAGLTELPVDFICPR